MMVIQHRPVLQREVTIPTGGVELTGDLLLPHDACGLVVFAHGSGSSRHSERNRYVAASLNDAGLGTLLFDLLTEDEEPIGRYSFDLRFNIPLLATRLLGVTRWAAEIPEVRGLPAGLFGASTGAAAALIAAAKSPGLVSAIVCRGGRVDLATGTLPLIKAPTLLLVGDNDPEVLAINRQAEGLINATHRLEVIAGASHLFEEPGMLQQAAALAEQWFLLHLRRRELRPDTPTGT